MAYLAPALLGGGTPVVGDLGISTIDDAKRLRLGAADLTYIDGDIRIVADVDRTGG
jgi:diaminohydroxyphosphoribosylaminopyrimidine deaminase/5-amino-6-(5-phosphoribosylamino)uracil reductase